ncbi:transcriptional regulator [Microbacterium sp. Y-01]|uniref:ArsR/SmtB family transcription factor n=1 Tax=Microbacterium sp. Y-01 TaxID=2048898 RepID=UPI000F5D9713|nr:metalloregulator ArsR/SmtB family transcription factor [Microbacterium sp. Y-01]AZH77283.1 transcriptional regulator [Microbacterium sp. Y-01]
MVAQEKLSEAEVDRVFHALATSTRRDILRRTIEREQSVSTLASEYEMSFAAVQKHVAVLEAANLIVKRAEGRERLVRANPEMIARARALLARYEELWRSRIARLDDLLADPSTSSGTHGVSSGTHGVSSGTHGAESTENTNTEQGD